MYVCTVRITTQISFYIGLNLSLLRVRATTCTGSKMAFENKLNRKGFTLKGFFLL